MLSKFPGYPNFMKVSHMDTGNPITTDETDEFGIDHTTGGA